MDLEHALLDKTWKSKIDIQELWRTLSTGLSYYSSNHENGKTWVHRDIKPANIMVYHPTKDGTLKYKIVDFGTATNNPENLIIAGTLSYMHPATTKIDKNNPILDIYSSLLTIFEVHSELVNDSQFGNF